MQYGLWTIGFYDPGCRPEDERLFGCATQGMTIGKNLVRSEEGCLAVWREAALGWVFSGTYTNVLAELRAFERTPSLALVFFAHGDGPESFLKALRALLPDTPIAGGGAAVGENGVGQLSPPGRDVAVLLIESEGFTVCAKNVLEPTGERFTFEAEGSRRIHRFAGPDGHWRNAPDALAEIKRARQVAADDFESLTFSDEQNRNLHFRAEGDVLASGADLPETGELILRHTPRPIAEAAIRAFAQRENALVIGCAGLKSLLTGDYAVPDNTLVLYLHGEIISGAFGNLMLSAVQPL